MAIVCIKIGENEPSSYHKFHKLSKHMDIIDVLPRKRDKDGNLLNRTMGVKGDKEYLGLNVDMSRLSDEQFNKLRFRLRKVWEEDTGKKHEDGSPIMETKAKRLYYVDLSKVPLIGLSQTTIGKINEMAVLKRKKKIYDMMKINKFHKIIPLSLFLRVVVNKKTGQTLAEELAEWLKTSQP